MSSLSSSPISAASITARAITQERPFDPVNGDSDQHFFHVTGGVPSDVAIVHARVLLSTSRDLVNLILDQNVDDGGNVVSVAHAASVLMEIAEALVSAAPLVHELVTEARDDNA